MKFTLAICSLALTSALSPLLAAEPLKVYLLAGQSNMQGHAHISTFDSMADDPQTAPLLKQMRDEQGNSRVCDRVWISSIGCQGDAYSDLTEVTGKLTAGFGAPEDKIGPEFTFGITLEQQFENPILIIKTAWGGRSLHTDFRSPSAGPYEWSEFELEQHRQRGDNLEQIQAEKREATGLFYRNMIAHVRTVLADIKRVVPDYDESQGYELAGFVWFQGFNDLVSGWTYDQHMEPGGYDLYAKLLAHLIRDVRADLASPELPVVIGVMGIGGLAENERPSQMYFRQAQRAAAARPEFQGNVIAVETARFWVDELEQLAERRDQLHHQLNEQFQKDGQLTGEQQDLARAAAERETFTPAERKRLLGVSNGGYHYLGAARILAPIGKAFAEAVLQLSAETSNSSSTTP